MLITLCHATYHCIKKPTEIRDLWLVNSIEKNLIEYIPGINEDDYDAISDTKDIKRFISPKTNICTAVKNWNGAASLSKGDLIVFLSQNLANDFQFIKAEKVANQYPIVGHHNDSFETIQGYFTTFNILKSF